MDPQQFISDDKTRLVPGIEPFRNREDSTVIQKSHPSRCFKKQQTTPNRRRYDDESFSKLRSWNPRPESKYSPRNQIGGNEIIFEMPDVCRARDPEETQTN
jgi:hypothetical protein